MQQSITSKRQSNSYCNEAHEAGRIIFFDVYARSLNMALGNR